MSAGCSTAYSVKSASIAQVSEACCLTTMQNQSRGVFPGQLPWAFQYNTANIAVACGTSRRLSDDSRSKMSSTSTARELGVGRPSGARAPNAGQSLLVRRGKQDESNQRNERRSGVREDDCGVLTRQEFLGGFALSAVAKTAVLAPLAGAVVGSHPAVALEEAGNAKSIQDIKNGVEADFLQG